MGRLLLVTGGARSGKSGWAQHRLEAEAGPRICIATCRIEDDEMAARVARHRAERAAGGWQTIEEPLAVAEALRSAPPGAVLIDCLTLWLANLMQHAAEQDCAFGEDDARTAAETLVSAAQQRAGLVVAVTNEVGSGIVPMAELSRRFRDCAGRMNQTLGAAADGVVVLVCGRALAIPAAG